MASGEDDILEAASSGTGSRKFGSSAQVASDESRNAKASCN
jgi:hypothetical protein